MVVNQHWWWWCLPFPWFEWQVCLSTGFACCQADSWHQGEPSITKVGDLENVTNFPLISAPKKGITPKYLKHPVTDQQLYSRSQHGWSSPSQTRTLHERWGQLFCMICSSIWNRHASDTRHDLAYQSPLKSPWVSHMTKSRAVQISEIKQFAIMF